MQNKFSKTFLTFMVTTLFLSGCTPQVSVNTSPDKPNPSDLNLGLITTDVNKEFTIMPGQKAQINGTDINVYFVDIESDNRCPSDNDCTENLGTATITLKVTKSGITSTTYPVHYVLGETKNFNEDYNLEFLKIAPERGKQFQEIPKANYQATLKLISTALSVPVAEISNPPSVIFPKETFENDKTFSGDLWKFVNGYWTPSVDEAKKADMIVQKCLTNKEKIATERVQLFSTGSAEQDNRQKDHYLAQLGKIEPIYSKYNRQFIGYTGKNNHKLVWINFFTMKDLDSEFSPSRIWKKSIVTPPNTTISTGNEYYAFNVLVDLDDESCVDFSIE